MDMDQRWLNRSPDVMLETFHWFAGEGFGPIVEDLLAPPGQPVLAEGFRPMPRLVKPLLASPGQALWLLPTPEPSGARPSAAGARCGKFAEKTSDPPLALRNLLERDRMFTERSRRKRGAFASRPSRSIPPCRRKPWPRAWMRCSLSVA